MRRGRALWGLIALAVFLLYFWHLGSTGLLGPDEPRYASISRAMARSGDWVTPRLWGEAWFEKPALLYWLSGAGYALGLPGDWAARLPIALLGAGFLGLFWGILRREFGERAAGFATAILATSAGWLGYSMVAVTDIPLSVTYGAAMLLALSWIGRGEKRWLPLVGALLGAAVLAKGLVPAVLALPLLLGWRRLRDLVSWRVAGSFLAVALPWYLLCYLRNGPAFLIDFFWKHHLERLTSSSLMHGQPWWFYLPVLVALLLPWSPLLGLAGKVRIADPRERFLIVWLVLGVVFFSTATNKLPGYLLPLLPAAAALLGIALDRARRAVWVLGLCVGLNVLYLIAVPMLPAALAVGLSRAPRPGFNPLWLLPLAAAGLAGWLERKGRRELAVTAVALVCGFSAFFLKQSAAPQVERQVSARSLWREVQPRAQATCVEEIHRSWRYGLNYYSVTPLPDCPAQGARWRVMQERGTRPRLEAVE